MTEKDFSTQVYLRCVQGELIPVKPYAIVSSTMVEVVALESIYGYKQGEHFTINYSSIVRITRPSSNGKYWTKTLERKEFPHKPTTVIYH